MTDEEPRIRGDLQGPGAKLSPAAIIDRVRAAMARLRSAAAAIRTARFRDRPVPESGKGVMDHVLEADRNFGDQIVAVLDGVDHSPATRRRVRGRSRQPRSGVPSSNAIAASCSSGCCGADPQNRLDAMIHHGMFGPLNWRETLLFLRLHDLDHAGRLRKIAAALAAA